MKRFMSKKVAAIGLAAGITLGLGGAAFAYFTATATGNGNASVGSTVDSTISPITITGAMYPAGPTVPVAFTINNLSTGTQKFGQVKVDPSYGSGTGIDGLPALCDPTWFTFNQSATTSYTIAGLGTASDSASLQLNNPGVNQDACQGATPVLHLITGVVS